MHTARHASGVMLQRVHGALRGVGLKQGACWCGPTCLTGALPEPQGCTTSRLAKNEEGDNNDSSMR